MTRRPKTSRPRTATERRKDAHYNTTGMPDALTDLIEARMRELGWNRVVVADLLTKFNPSDRAPYEGKPSEARTISPSLVVRILQGRRNIPMGDVLAWSKALALGSPKRIHAFAIIVALASALRDLRSKLPAHNSARRKLEPMLEKTLNKHKKDFTWFD